MPATIQLCTESWMYEVVIVMAGERGCVPGDVVVKFNISNGSMRWLLVFVMYVCAHTWWSIGHGCMRWSLLWQVSMGVCRVVLQY